MVHGENRIPCWIDRRLTGLAGPEYHAIISIGLPFEPEDSQYGKSRFIVLAQPATTSQPRQCSLNHPPAWQHLKLMAGPGTLDDLQDPARHGHHPVHQLAAVASVSPDESQAWESSYQFIDDQPRPISVLDIGRMHHHRQQQAYGIYDDVSLSTVDLLTSIIATRPPFSVVFTLWLSMIAALGVGFLPSASRTQGRSVSLTRSHVPSMVQLRKYLYRVCQGGRSCGTIRQGHPLRSKYRMPFTTSRRTIVRGRPPGLAGGSRGPRISHCSSVRSLGYDLRLIHQV